MQMIMAKVKEIKLRVIGKLGGWVGGAETLKGCLVRFWLRFQDHVHLLCALSIVDTIGLCCI